MIIFITDTFDDYCWGLLVQFYGPFILRLVISFISLSLFFFFFLVSALMHAFSVSVECPTYSRRSLHSGWWGFSAPHECWTLFNPFSSVHLSPSVMSDFLQPHEPQGTRLPCPSATPWVHPNSCPLKWWCHTTISSSVIPFSSCLQSFPASDVFTSESALLIRWSKYWSFSFSISLSSEYSGLISFYCALILRPIFLWKL